MMTSVLRDSLGGNCKTIMIATINPEASHTEESLSTCRFAQRVSLIKNKATINEVVIPNLPINPDLPVNPNLPVNPTLPVTQFNLTLTYPLSNSTQMGHPH